MSTERTFIIDQLEDVDYLKSFGHIRGVYRTVLRSAMLEAQLILEGAGYVLDIDDVQAIPGSFYQLRYTNYDEGSYNPNWVVLQYDTQRLMEPVPIALFYWTYDESGRRHVTRWGTPFDITNGTGTSDAEKIMVRFEQSFDDAAEHSRPVWVPVFDNKQGLA